MRDVDVAIVGAGSAGLGAAKIARESGLDFVVLEAMDRIGGRAFTSSEHFGVPFDIGCAWLHAADRNPYYPEAQHAGWTLQYHQMDVDHLYYNTRRASTEEMAAMKAAEAELYELLEKWDAEEDRLSALIAKGHATRAAATFSGPMDFGKD
ncbi:MAG: FAD-dependent oxidoreductase, partial [Rhizobiaceae bacterium]|nr:FAD-dependent oxidoreductase [Rhizobiaceae bacterium]